MNNMKPRIKVKQVNDSTLTSGAIFTLYRVYPVAVAKPDLFNSVQLNNTIFKRNANLTEYCKWLQDINCSQIADTLQSFTKGL